MWLGVSALLPSALSILSMELARMHAMGRDKAALVSVLSVLPIQQ